MKHYTVAIYDLRMCIKGDNPGQKYFKEIISIFGMEYRFAL